MNETSTLSTQESLIKSWDNHNDISSLSFKLNDSGQVVGIIQDGNELAGEQWLDSIPMMQTRNLIGRNIDRGLLVPKQHSDVAEQNEFLSKLFDWTIEERLAKGLVGSLTDQELSVYLIERIIGQSSIYADLISDDLPNTDSPFHFLVELVSGSEIWLPLYCTAPMGIMSVELAGKLLGQLGVIHKREKSRQPIAMWLPKNKGNFLDFETSGAVETVPPKSSTDLSEKYEVGNESCKIPVQLVRKTNELNIGQRVTKERIYCFTDEYQEGFSGKEKAPPIPPGILLLADLHMSEKRTFSYQCTSREYGRVKYRNHYFQEVVAGNENFVSDVEDLMVEKIYELPSVFEKEGFKVYLESDCSFYPNIENFDNNAIKKFLVGFLSCEEESDSESLKSSINLYKLSKNKPIERIILKDENWQPLEKVIDPIIKGLSPDLYLEASESYLVTDAANRLKTSGNIYIQFLEKTVLNELEMSSKKVLAKITKYLSEIDNDLNAIQTHLIEISEIRRESKSAISEFLSSEWDDFYQKIYKFHSQILEKVNSWNIDNLKVIGQRNSTLVEVQSKVAQSKENIKSAVVELKELNSVLEKDVSTLEKLTLEVGLLRNDSEKLWLNSKKRREKAETDLLTYQNESDVFSEKVKENSEYMDSASRKVTQLQESVDKKIEKLNIEYEDLSALKMNLMRSQDSCRSLIQEVEQQKGQIETEKKRLTKLENEYQSKNHPKVKVDLAEVQNQVNRKESQIIEVNKQIKIIEEKRNEHSALISEFKDRTQEEAALRTKLNKFLKGVNGPAELEMSIERLKITTELLTEMNVWKDDLFNVSELSSLTNEEISAIHEIHRRIDPLMSKMRTSPLKRRLKLVFKPVQDFISKFKKNR